MLKAVVQQVHLRLKLLLSESPSLIAAFADDHRHAQFPRDQQRLISEIRRTSRRINHQHAASSPSITSRKNVERNVALFQQFPERNHEGSLTRTTHREISYTDDRPLQSMRRQDAAIEERISQGNTCAVESAQRIHAGPLPISWTSASTVLTVAPRCDWSAARALRPRVSRASALSISSISTSGNSASPTMRTALRSRK